MMANLRDLPSATAAATTVIAGIGFAITRACLGERHVQLNPGGIGLIDFGRLRHLAFALAAFRRKQVPARCMLTHHFARPGDLEPLRD